MYKVDTRVDRIYSVITAEVYKVYNGSLPVIVEGQIRIKNPNGTDVFSSIFHTKTILTFEQTENPVNDLMKMLEDVESQEKKVWGSRILATPLHGLFLEVAQPNLDVRLNKACQIRDIAKQRNLII